MKRIFDKNDIVLLKPVKPQKTDCSCCRLGCTGADQIAVDREFPTSLLSSPPIQPTIAVPHDPAGTDAVCNYALK